MQNTGKRSPPTSRDIPWIHKLSALAGKHAKVSASVSANWKWPNYGTSSIRRLRQQRREGGSGGSGRGCARRNWNTNVKRLSSDIRRVALWSVTPDVRASERQRGRVRERVPPWASNVRDLHAHLWSTNHRQQQCGTFHWSRHWTILNCWIRL